MTSVSAAAPGSHQKKSATSGGASKPSAGKKRIRPAPDKPDGEPPAKIAKKQLPQLQEITTAIFKSSTDVACAKTVDTGDDDDINDLAAKLAATTIVVRQLALEMAGSYLKGDPPDAQAVIINTVQRMYDRPTTASEWRQIIRLNHA